MEEAMPEVFGQFKAVVERLERHYRDMQDIEFTVEQGRLYMLQTRNGKRTAKAALKIAVDMAAEGLITQDEAVMRVEPASLDQLLHPTIDPDADARRDRHGPAGLAGRGHRQDRVRRRARPSGWAQAGEAVILVRDETSPGGHPRHARGRGHRHRARRHDQPRGGGGARHGPALRLRRRRAADRREGRRVPRARPHASRPAT